MVDDDGDVVSLRILILLFLTQKRLFDVYFFFFVSFDRSYRFVIVVAVGGGVGVATGVPGTRKIYIIDFILTRSFLTSCALRSLLLRTSLLGHTLDGEYFYIFFLSFFRLLVGWCVAAAHSFPPICTNTHTHLRALRKN